MVEWAKDPENHKAWKDIMQRENLTFDPFLDIEANFLIGDMLFVVFGPLSMNKVSEAYTKLTVQATNTLTIGTSTWMDRFCGHHGEYLRDESRAECARNAAEDEGAGTAPACLKLAPCLSF